MTTRRDLLNAVPAAGALLALAPAVLTTRSPALAQEAAAPGPLWRSMSLVEDTVTAPNGAITTRDMMEANDRLTMAEKRAIEVAPDVWLLTGWGIAHSMAIRTPEGWIIVDTGDSTRAAKEMREKLEAAVGGPVRVAAILLTHWHYADGTAAWADKGAELWGHEWLDSNRTAGSGVGPLAGFYQARAISQFAVFHPTEGADAFPNNLRFSPEKLLAESSYRPPARLFTNGTVETLAIAGEKVDVMPNRSDSSDSVGFYFPRQRLLVSNFMVPGFIFNIYSLRGGPQSRCIPTGYPPHGVLRCRRATRRACRSGYRRRGSARRNPAFRRSGPAHSRPVTAHDRPRHGWARGGRGRLHAAGAAQGLGILRAGRKPCPPDL
jgi:glyoxylase-like metal-dependent hydrolase (beta-lactamase superfamily II)